MGRGGAASQTPCAPQGLHPHPACVARSSWGWKGPLGTSQSNNPPPSSRQAPEPPQEFSDVASLPESTHSKRGSLV